jgi:hypothetical protein
VGGDVRVGDDVGVLTADLWTVHVLCEIERNKIIKYDFIYDRMSLVREDFFFIGSKNNIYQRRST